MYDPLPGRAYPHIRGAAAGRPADPATTLGPLSFEQAAKDLTAQVRDAVGKGATAVTGGGRPDHQGAFVDTTILTGVRPDMRAYSEELFGPVPVYSVASDDEAIGRANATSFGLGGTVMCSDPRARTVGGGARG